MLGPYLPGRIFGRLSGQLTHFTTAPQVCHFCNTPRRPNRRTSPNCLLVYRVSRVLGKNYTVAEARGPERPSLRGVPSTRETGAEGASAYVDDEPGRAGHVALTCLCVLSVR